MHPSVGVPSCGVASGDSAGEGGGVSDHNPCEICCDLNLWWYCIQVTEYTSLIRIRKRNVKSEVIDIALHSGKPREDLVFWMTFRTHQTLLQFPGESGRKIDVCNNNRFILLAIQPTNWSIMKNVPNKSNSATLIC